MVLVRMNHENILINIWIDKAFAKAKKKAWASIQDHPEIIRLVQEAKKSKAWR